MKKTLLTCLALAMSAPAVQARDIAAGTLMVTGDTNMDISSSETNFSGSKSTTDTTKINLTSLYFLDRNFGVGLLIGSESTEVDDGVSVSKQSTAMLGPIVGYNISINPDVSITLHGSIFTLTGEMNDGVFNADLDGDGYMFGGVVNYFLNERVAANVGLRMVNANVDFTSGGTKVAADMDETGVSVGLSTFF